jgi:hypothetical protein
MAMRRSFASIERRNREELVMPRFKIDEKISSAVVRSDGAHLAL